MVEFLAVYVREAHPLDGVLPERQSGLWLNGTPERNLFIEDPLTYEERLALARRCASEMQLGFPMLVDELDDRGNVAYAAWPERLALIDLDGTLAYLGVAGPQGYDPDELSRVIRRSRAAWAEGRPAGEAARLPEKPGIRPQPPTDR